LEELLGVHATHVPQSSSDGISTMEPVMQEPAPTTAIQSTSSLPSSTLLQHPNRTGQQFHTYNTFRSREVQPPARLVPSSAHGSQGAFRQGNRARSVTPAPHPGPSTSHSLLQMGGGTSSVDFTTSTFSFQAPNRMNYPVHRVPQNDHGLRPISTGYPSDSRGFASSTQPSTQAQTGEAPARPGT
jgi:hypothetical protein